MERAGARSARVKTTTAMLLGLTLPDLATNREALTRRSKQPLPAGQLQSQCPRRTARPDYSSSRRRRVGRHREKREIITRWCRIFEMNPSSGKFISSISSRSGTRRRASMVKPHLNVGTFQLIAKWLPLAWRQDSSNLRGQNWNATAGFFPGPWLRLPVHSGTG